MHEVVEQREKSACSGRGRPQCGRAERLRRRAKGAMGRAPQGIVVVEGRLLPGLTQRRRKRSSGESSVAAEKAVGGAQRTSSAAAEAARHCPNGGEPGAEERSVLSSQARKMAPLSEFALEWSSGVALAEHLGRRTRAHGRLGS